MIQDRNCPDCGKGLHWYCPICDKVFTLTFRSRHNRQQHGIDNKPEKAEKSEKSPSPRKQRKSNTNKHAKRSKRSRREDEDSDSDYMPYSPSSPYPLSDSSSSSSAPSSPSSPSVPQSPCQSDCATPLSDTDMAENTVLFPCEISELLVCFLFIVMMQY